MPAPAELLELYLHLARASEEQRKPLQRDKFLVLAGGAALEANFPRVAEECRRRLLADNPNHILRNFSTMREAFESEDIVHYANQLLRYYPFEKAEYLLEKYRAGGYSSGHGYGSIVESKTSDSALRSGSRELSASSGGAQADFVNDLADFDLEALGSLDEYGDDRWPELHETGRPTARNIPVRTAAVVALVAFALGGLLGAAIVAACNL